MNSYLLTPEIQQYLIDHESHDLAQVILAGSPFNNVSPQELAQQLEGRKSSKNKLPTWYNTPNIYYPPKTNIEQTSGEIAAEYKTRLVSGNTLADLTGGLGIDAYYYSKKVEEVTYIEKNTELAEIAAHNFDTLNAKSIDVIVADSIEYLKRQEIHFDTLYIDPSRRHDVKGKVFLLTDCEPNVPANLDLLFIKSERIIVKTSPLLDLQAGLEQLQKVSEIHIVAVKNEVKEVLWILDKSAGNSLKLTAANLTGGKNEIVDCDYFEGLKSEATYSPALTYIYEPNAALMKSGLFTWIAANYGLYKLHPNTHLYTSEKIIEFPGRTFIVEQKLPYTRKNILKNFKGCKANVSKRNFKENIAQLRKKYKISDGGNRYLIFTTDSTDQQWVLDCKKIKQNDTGQ